MRPGLISAVIAVLLSLGAAHSSPQAATWQRLPFTQPEPVRCVLARGSLVLAGTDSGLLQSPDAGGTWLPIGEGLDSGSVMLLYDAGNRLLAVQGNRIYRSSDVGRTWVATAQTQVASSVIGFQTGGDSLFAIGSVFPPHERLLSLDSGLTWTTLGQWEGDPGPIDFAAGADSVFRISYGHLYLSLDRGASWRTAPYDTSFGQIATASISDREMYLTTQFGVLMRSRDRGLSWNILPIGSRSARILALAANGRSLCAESQYGISCSEDAGAHWTFLRTNYLGVPDRQLAAGDDRLYLAPVALSYEGQFSVYRFTDQSWTTGNRGSGSRMHEPILAAHGRDVVMLDGFFTGNGFYRSEDRGSTFALMRPSWGGMHLHGMSLGKNRWAGVGDGVMLLSSDRGVTWKQEPSDNRTLNVFAIAVADSDAILIGGEAGIRGFNFARSAWYAIPPAPGTTGATQSDPYPIRITASDSALFLANAAGLWRRQLYGEPPTALIPHRAKASHAKRTARLRIQGGNKYPVKTGEYGIDARGRRDPATLP
ncbi:MAG: sialidase [Fibrobacteres bacterium]|nr:sialidase [Fibrobacterota bacterium]